MLSTTYKKKKCEFYNRGSCTKGSQCTYDHNFIPDVAKVTTITNIEIMQILFIWLMYQRIIMFIFS